MSFFTKSFFGILLPMILSFLPIFSFAMPEEVPLYISDSFTYNDNYYVTLSNNNCFQLQKTIIKKAAGWFDSDQYGNPAAGWLAGDSVQIIRTGAYDYPFQIINMDTCQEVNACNACNACSVKIELKAFEDLSVKLQELININNDIKSTTDSIHFKIYNAHMNHVGAASE